MVTVDEALKSDDPKDVKRARAAISTQISCDVGLLKRELGKVKASSVHPLPDLKESPIPRISRLKKRILSNNSCVSGKLEDCDSMASGCSHTRSAHGSHSMPRETGLRSDRLILPRIEKSQSQSSTAVSSAESNLLEVRHGNTSQFIRILDGILLS